MSKTVIRFLLAAISTIAAVALGYMAYLAVDVNRSTIQTLNVQMATADEGFSVDAMIFSDEALVLKGRGQSCLVLAENGEKVGGGEDFAVCFSNDTAKEKYVRLEKLRKTLAVAAEAKATKTDSATLKALNSEISDIARSFSSSAGQGGLISEYGEEEMVGALLARQLCLGNSDGIDALCDSLKAEISALENGAESGQVISAEKSGYFSAIADGWEQVVSVDRLLDFDFEEYQEAMRVGALSIDTDRVVGKMVYGYTWYLCTVTDSETAGYINPGKELTVKIAGEERSMSVLRKEYSPDGKDVFITMECRVPLSNISVERDQTVTIIGQSYEGFRVPAEAIRMEDGVTGVYVLEGAQAIFKPAEIIYSGDGYYLVSGSETDRNRVCTNDAVIVGGKGLHDGKVIG
ncbi:MAG: hypothetical protein IIX84_00860 [Oscillospiraceae bacterium]|nr:hypothetical protein [Oscillospiraceae bacterium]